MVKVNSPKDLCTLAVDFKPQPKYSRDHPTTNSSSDTSDNGKENVIVVN